MFDSFTLISLGLFSGFVFGFLLQKGGVTKYEVIVKQFLLQDFTVLKTMLTAIVVGGFGVYFLEGQGLAKLSIKPAILVANIGGGLIFGVGMVLLGLCPGMLTGAWIQAETYGPISGCAKWVDLGSLTLSQVLKVSPMVVLTGLAVISVSLFLAIEFFERRKESSTAR